MVDSLKRGYAFLIQAWRMARTDPDLFKPSVYTLLAGLIFLIIGLIPIAGSVLLFSGRTYGQVVTGFFAALLFLSMICAGSILSAMNVYLVYGYLAEGDGRVKGAWDFIRRNWLDLLGLSVAALTTDLMGWAVQRWRAPGAAAAKRHTARAGGTSGHADPASDASSAQESIWSQAALLALPAMVIEDLSLKDGLLRGRQIMRDRLLPIDPGFIGLRPFNLLAGLILGALGIAAGLGVGLKLVLAANKVSLGVIGGLAAGLLIGSVFLMAAVVLAGFTSRAYQTCLYLWARDVELAQHESQAEASPPAPLAAVLSPATPETAVTISQS